MPTPTTTLLRITLRVARKEPFNLHQDQRIPLVSHLVQQTERGGPWNSLAQDPAVVFWGGLEVCPGRGAWNQKGPKYGDAWNYHGERLPWFHWKKPSGHGREPAEKRLLCGTTAPSEHAGEGGADGRGSAWPLYYDII